MPITKSTYALLGVLISIGILCMVSPASTVPCVHGNSCPVRSRCVYRDRAATALSIGWAMARAVLTLRPRRLVHAGSLAQPRSLLNDS